MKNVTTYNATFYLPDAVKEENASWDDEFFAAVLAAEESIHFGAKTYADGLLERRWLLLPDPLKLFAAGAIRTSKVLPVSYVVRSRVPAIPESIQFVFSSSVMQIQNICQNCRVAQFAGPRRRVATKQLLSKRRKRQCRGYARLRNNVGKRRANFRETVQ